MPFVNLTLAIFRIAEFGFFALGLLWARPYLTRNPAVREWSALSSQLGFGFTFFGANLLLMSVWRGGELAVLLFSGRSAEVAFYSVANAVAQSNQTLGLYASSNTYLTSSGTVDARSLTFRGDKSKGNWQCQHGNV